MKEILHPKNNKRIAYIANINKLTDGESVFLGKNEDFIQVGIHNKKKSSLIAPHKNHPQLKKITINQEAILVVKGKAEVSFYTDDGEMIEKQTLKAGDLVVFLGGGHGFKFLEKTQLLELKQGPYFGIDSQKL